MVFFFFFKQCTLEVLDLHDNCEEYFHILHNQFPLLPLYISIKHLFNLVNPHWKSIVNYEIVLLTKVWTLSDSFSTVQFSRSVVSNSLRPHEQHAKPPCPSPTPGVYPNSCPLSQWCHPTISSSIIPFSQHQDLFQWISSSHQVAKVLEFQLQDQSLQWTIRTDLL